MALRSSSTNNGTSITRSTTVPAGVATDDIIVIITDADGASNSTGTIPAGFTAFFTDATIAAPDGERVTAAWKRATGADSGSYTFGAGANTDWVCQAFAFSGRHTTNPPVQSTNAVDTNTNPSPVTVTANGVTALDGDDLLWLSAPDSTIGGAVLDHTAPTGYTEKQDQTLGFASLSGATKENVAAGATGSVAGSFTLSSGTSGWLSVLIRIPSTPAVGGGAHSLSALGVGT